jgi:nicotinate-nucleotide--dimethylbenzimidazole phosphoribosyltransferase
MHLPPITAIQADSEFSRAVQAQIDIKTKPLGALGRIEALALQIACIQNRIKPAIASAQVYVFAGDHGIAAEGVSAFPQAVTTQMVANFLSGGAAISVFARANDATVTVVDAGVASPLPSHPNLIDRKIALGTQNFLYAPAMRIDELERAMVTGIEIGAKLPPYSALVFGEMGIANTTSAAALMHALTGLPIAQCVGRGTGLADEGVAHKAVVIARAFSHQGSTHGPLHALQVFGGFEIAMMCGAMLGAASQRQVVIVDGFISTAAAAVAIALDPNVQAYFVFAHVSAEGPHRAWLEQLGAQPLLDLGMRLGEGSAGVLALPLLRAACAMLCEMATFESAGVSEKTAP